jgi:hypothetical protein
MPPPANGGGGNGGGGGIPDNPFDPEEDEDQ